MQKESFDYAIKTIVIGDVAVGKTCLISQFITGQFNSHHDFTVGIEFGDKRLSINGHIVKVQIWDTAGQQEFKSVTRSYYRSCAAALVVFDITRRDTFRSVVGWVQDVKNNASSDVVLVLVGNKSDLSQDRMVDRADALKLAREYEMLYIETSAKNQENVERAFSWPVSIILDKIEGGFIKLDSKNQAIKVQKGNLSKQTSS